MLFELKDYKELHNHFYLKNLNKQFKLEPKFLKA